MSVVHREEALADLGSECLGRRVMVGRFGSAHDRTDRAEGDIGLERGRDQPDRVRIEPVDDGSELLGRTAPARADDRDGHLHHRPMLGEGRVGAPGLRRVPCVAYRRGGHPIADIPGRFESQVVVVTGSATGIGAATVHRFASEGALVAGLDTNRVDNETTAARADDATGSGTAIALDCDVRAKDDQKAAFSEVMNRWGRVDVLVACAGIYVGGPLPEVPLERWHDIAAVNLTGVLVSNQLVAPIMMSQGSGRIVNVSSMAGKTSWPYSAEYSATKSGVIGITRSVAMELGPYGITANALCPGNTLTAMVRKVAEEVGATVGMTGEEWLEMRANDTALKRLAEPAEIAAVIAFLASADASYLTGQAIEVDGGLVLS